MDINNTIREFNKIGGKLTEIEQHLVSENDKSKLLDIQEKLLEKHSVLAKTIAEYEIKNLDIKLNLNQRY